MNKLVSSIREAVELSGLRDGMTVSFHHHLRNGDYVLNMVMEQIAALGIKDLTVNASSLFDVHQPLADHIRNHVVTALQTDYMSAGLGREISRGLMEKPVEFRTHGGRPSDIASGRIPIDVAFIAAPSADPMGNCTGKFGKSACGSLGYAIPDAMYAKKVVVITDNLVSYPLEGWSIPEIYVDYVVSVDAIGDPEGIVSGTTRITRDPVGLVMASYAAKVIERSGLLKDGFSFQTGAGGASLAAAGFLKEIMLEKGVQGSFGLGGITGYMVDMLQAGCFQSHRSPAPGDLRPPLRQPHPAQRSGGQPGRGDPGSHGDRHGLQRQRPHRLQRQHYGRLRRPQRHGGGGEAVHDHRAYVPCPAAHRHRPRDLYFHPRGGYRRTGHPGRHRREPQKYGAAPASRGRRPAGYRHPGAEGKGRASDRRA